MEGELDGFVSAVEVGEPDECDRFTRSPCTIETEPDVRIEFWLLRPKEGGPFPLAVTPHGHEDRGHDTYGGAAHDDRHYQLRIAGARGDVAVQAAERGFLAIAPNTRGFPPSGVPDLNSRHDDRPCRSQLIHCLLAGRTAIGERVYDLRRILDWALTHPEVDSSTVLMMGNSGGGVATTYATACDERITAAVASCSFCTYVGKNGLIHHCDCNCVPGILRFGDFPDVAGLIAPRPFLAVNGRHDALFPPSEVERALDALRRIYAVSAAPANFRHAWGPEGHRFYPELMWPFVAEVCG